MIIKNIIFDFDGVIAESVNVKTDAFRIIYLKYGEGIAEKAVNHHRVNGGMSRYEKFKLYHKDFLGVHLSEEEVEQLAIKFSSLVTSGVINAPEVKGSHEFLREHKNKYKMFIITGTPTEESKKICQERDIYSYFQGIFGSPPKKDYWSKYILEKFTLKKEETIFVGDALADYNAAISNNLRFFLREYGANEELFKNIEDIYRFYDFIEFKNLLDTIK